MDGLTKELQLSPRWAIATLTLIAILLVWQSDQVTTDGQHLTLLIAALLTYGIVGVAWLLARQSERTKRGSALALVWLAFQGLIFFLDYPGVLVIAALPPLLSLYCVGLRAALIAIGLQLLTAFLAWQMAWLDGPLIGAMLLNILLVVGIAALAHHQAWQVASQVWQQYLESRAALNLARERNLLLDQTRDDLLHANRQLLLLNERLAALRAHAEELESSKTTFITKVSHEFRSPLNMIIGLADLLLDAPNVYGAKLPKPLTEDIRILHRNCNHLTAMINDVLDLSQTEAGRLTLHMAWENLNDEIQLAVESVTPLFIRKNLHLHVDNTPSLPLIYCDRTRMRQVLLNLLTNAGRYTDTGSVTVSTTKTDTTVTISIADTGPGIPEQDQARIFEPFYHSSSVNVASATKPGEGSGLGLSICKQFVELHRGKLWLESEVGHGTIFHVELPIAPPRQQTIAQNQWVMESWPWYERPNRPHASVPAARLRVILYDETGVLEQYADYRTNEIEWLPCHSINDALHTATETPAHLLLLNTSSVTALPSLLYQVQANLRDTPIVGCAFPAQVAHILAAGAIDYLVKPVTRHDLLQTLHAFDEPIRRILLVDDDHEFQDLIRRMLLTDDNTLTILTASNGQQALERMAAEQPDLVLLDLMMPIMDGWQVLAHKEADDAISAIPVIVLSSQDPTPELPTTPWITVAWNQNMSAETTLRGAIGAAAAMLAHNQPLPAISAAPIQSQAPPTTLSA